MARGRDGVGMERLGERVTLNDLLVSTCRRRDSAIGLWWGDRSFTFREILERVARAAGSLKDRGVRPGDPVGVLLPNGPGSVFAHLAIQWLGAIRVPINAAYTRSEIAHPVESAGCRYVITDSERRERVSVEVILAEELQNGQAIEAAAVPTSDVAMICFTSGTTSRPKKVPLTHGNFVHNIRALAETWEWTERDTLVLCLPLMHLHGLANGLNGWLLTGCTLVLMEKFDAIKVQQEIDRHRATMFFGVPAMYHRLLEAGPRADLSSMRLWVSGSAQLDRVVEDRFAQTFGHPIVNRYGMTETVMIAANPARAPRAGSVGRALEGVELRLEKDEVWVRGPAIGKVDLEPGGWFRTGDLGRVEEGWLYLTGRAKDLIICGGTNIAPMEIEEVLLQHPDVAEAAVFAGADEALGEVPCAVIVARPGRRLSSADVMQWTEDKMAKFKRLRRVEVSEQPLPRNAMQKLDRNKVKELYGS